MIRGGSDERPACFVCGRSTVHLDSAVYCSKGCEHRALAFKGGTTMQRHVAQAKSVSKFYAANAVRLDEGLWPGQTLRDKQAQIQRRWKDQ